MAEPGEKLGLDVVVKGFKKFMANMKAMDLSIDKTSKAWTTMSTTAKRAMKVLGGASKVVKAMATVLRMAAKISKTLGKVLVKASKIAVKALGKIVKVGKRVVGVLGKVAKIGLKGIAVGAIAAVGAIGGVTVALGKMAMEAAPVQGLQSAFNGLTKSFVGGSEAMLKGLQAASGGMIANRDLMQSFNKAASLVSIDFAQNLPEAMKYLGKVSAATGQDVGYLMDSMVTGVGRLSPMILDNLGIQVSATEASKAYAEAHGLIAEELTKEQQQMAMYEMVLEKLAKTTADMPDVADSAAQGIANFNTQVQNIKDDIGIALLPVLQILMGELNKLAAEVGPKIVEWAQKAGEWLGDKLPGAVYAIQRAFESFTGGDTEQGMKYLTVLIKDLFGEEAGTNFENFIDIAERVKESIGRIAETLASGSIALALANMQTLIGLVFGEESAEKFEGFRKKFLEIRDVVINAVDEIKAWFEVNWPIIQAAAITAWTVISDVVMAVVDTLVNEVWPLLQEAFANIEEALATFGMDWSDVWAGIKMVIAGAAIVIAALLLFFVGVLTGVIKAIAGFVKHITDAWVNITETFKLGVEAISQLIGGAMAIIKGIIKGDLELIAAGWKAWRKGLWDLLTALWQGIINLFDLSFGTVLTLLSEFVTGFIDFFKNLYDRLVGGSIIPEMMAKMISIFKDKFKEIVTLISDKLKEIVQIVIDFAEDMYDAGIDMMTGLYKGIREKVKDIIRAVGGWIQDIIDEALRRIGAKSPSTVFRDIGHDMMEGLILGLADLAPAVQAQVNAAVSPVMGSGSTTSITNSYEYNYNLTTQSAVRAGALAAEFESMEMATR